MFQIEDELKIISQYEPKLYKAVNYIFGDSYEYTREYREFRKEMEENNTKNNAFMRFTYLEFEISRGGF